MTKFIDSDGQEFKPVKVGKAGKLFELLISRLEESIKDEDVIVYADHNIENLEGFSRQFDVYIKSNIQGYQIEIAIECKEYGRDAVDVEKIESFMCKCQRIPSINKMVFVSQTGYSKGAIAAAKVYGISLLNIDTLDQGQLTNIIQPLNFKLQKRFIRIIKVVANKPDRTGKLITNFDTNTIEFEGYGKEVSIREFCTSFIVNLDLKQWESFFKSSADKSIPVDCSYLIFPEAPMIIGCEHDKDQYSRMALKTEIHEEIIELAKTGTKVYKEFNSEEAKLEFVQLEGEDKDGRKAIGELIMSKDKPLLTINFSLIEDKKIVCSESNTYNLDNLVKK